MKSSVLPSFAEERCPDINPNVQTTTCPPLNATVNKPKCGSYSSMAVSIPLPDGVKLFGRLHIAYAGIDNPLHRKHDQESNFANTQSHCPGPDMRSSHQHVDSESVLSSGVRARGAGKNANNPYLPRCMTVLKCDPYRDNKPSVLSTGLWSKKSDTRGAGSIKVQTRASDSHCNFDHDTDGLNLFTSPSSSQGPATSQTCQSQFSNDSCPSSSFAIDSSASSRSVKTECQNDANDQSSSTKFTSASSVSSLSSSSFSSIETSPGENSEQRRSCKTSSGSGSPGKDAVEKDIFPTLGVHYLCVDVRGTGNSTGEALDEYSSQERNDMLDVLKWILEQPWSNGEICLYGISYSANNALHTLISLWSPGHEIKRGREEMQQLRKAIHSIFILHASDSAFDTDIHWYGGIHTVSDQLQYSIAMAAENLLPRETNVTSNSSTLTQRERQEAVFSNWEFDTRLFIRPWLVNWLNKDDKAYWNQYDSDPLNSCDWSQIETPVFIYGGFRDLYCISALRLHQKIPRNVTLISGQGHERPSEFGQTFLWWLRTRPQLVRQPLCLPSQHLFSRVSSSLLVESNQITYPIPTLYAYINNNSSKTSSSTATFHIESNQIIFEHPPKTSSSVPLSAFLHPPAAGMAGPVDQNCQGLTLVNRCIQGPFYRLTPFRSSITLGVAPDFGSVTWAVSILHALRQSILKKEWKREHRMAQGEQKTIVMRVGVDDTNGLVSSIEDDLLCDSGMTTEQETQENDRDRRDHAHSSSRRLGVERSALDRASPPLENDSKQDFFSDPISSFASLDPISSSASLCSNFCSSSYVICGSPHVKVTVYQPPNDFYIVAWLFDRNGMLLSLGVKRHTTQEGDLQHQHPDFDAVKNLDSAKPTAATTNGITLAKDKENSANRSHNNEHRLKPSSTIKDNTFNETQEKNQSPDYYLELDIPLHPICTSDTEFYVRLSLSCVPLVMPQHEVKSVVIKKAKCVFPIEKCELVQQSEGKIKTMQSSNTRNDQGNSNKPICSSSSSSSRSSSSSSITKCTEEIGICSQLKIGENVDSLHSEIRSQPGHADGPLELGLLQKKLVFPIPPLPTEPSLELDNLDIQQQFDPVNNTYACSSREIWPSLYEEYFSFETSSSATRFAMKEIYYFPHGTVYLDAIFNTTSANSFHSHPVGYYHIKRWIQLTHEEEQGPNQSNQENTATSAKDKTSRSTASPSSSQITICLPDCDFTFVL